MHVYAATVGGAHRALCRAEKPNLAYAGLTCVERSRNEKLGHNLELHSMFPALFEKKSCRLSLSTRYMAYPPGNPVLCGNRLFSESMTLNSSSTVMNLQPGDPSMKTNGRSTASYLARTPRVPVFLLFLWVWKQTGFQTSRVDIGSLPLYVLTLTRSYSVSNSGICCKLLFYSCYQLLPLS